MKKYFTTNSISQRQLCTVYKNTRPLHADVPLEYESTEP